MLEINKNPEKKDLNWFGLSLMAAISLIGLIQWWGREEALATAKNIWLGAGIFGVVYYAIPPLRRFWFVGFMYLVFPIGFVLSHVILGLIFFLLIAPLGLIMRLGGYDPLKKSLDRGADSYWLKRPPAATAGSYFKQF